MAEFTPLVFPYIIADSVCRGGSSRDAFSPPRRGLSPPRGGPGPFPGELPAREAEYVRERERLAQLEQAIAAKELQAQERMLLYVWRHETVC